MKTLTIILLLLFLAGCTPMTPAATATAVPTATPRPTATATGTPTRTPSLTASPTHDYRVTYPENGHRYLAVNLLMSWHQANEYCFSQGGHLATIQTDEENQFVARMAIGADMWLGATDEAEEGTWLWVSGERWSYSYWHAGEPGNCCPAQHCGPQECTPENYLAIDHTGGWNDEPERQQLFFICEWDGSA